MIGQLDIFAFVVPDAPAESPSRYHADGRRKRSLGHRPPEIRFWEKVDLSNPDGCWMWTASTYRNGYGQFTVLAKPFKAHRWAYQNLVGPIPDGMQLDHTCHTRGGSCVSNDDCPHRRCVNPAHLEIVTPRLNSHRGNGIAGVNHRKTHCLRNHPFDVGNTRFTKRGGRVCRRCHATKVYEQRARKRQELSS